MHSHILFGVDDGPKDFDEAIKLLEQATREGITTIIATSHIKHPLYSVDYEVVKEQVECLQETVEERKLPLNLYTGHEVRLTENMLELYEMKQIHTLANSKYLLVELPNNMIPFYTKKLIVSLVGAGITPIIAHPERNRAIIENPKRLEILVREGALSQITAGSLTGQFGRKIQHFSMELVRSNLVHTYGSDVHNLSTRPFLFNQGLKILEKHKEFEAVDYLLGNNEKIVRNERIIPYEPEDIIPKKWRRIFKN
ncbi:CpsB/CapC family capsule biosynthesis tyrosine phosphatase [Lysinibacillus agricola]